MLCLGGKCPDHPEARLCEIDRITYFVESPECRQLYDLAGGLVELVWKIHVEERTSIEIHQVHTEDACGRRRSAVAVQEQDHLHINVQRHQVVAKQERIVCRQNALRVASFAKDFEPGRW